MNASDYKKSKNIKFAKEVKIYNYSLDRRKALFTSAIYFHVVLAWWPKTKEKKHKEQRIKFTVFHTFNFGTSLIYKRLS